MVRIGKEKLLVYRECSCSNYLHSREGPQLLAIEINPVDSSGSASKKRGVVIRSGAELEEINRLLSNPKLSLLAKSIDEVNPVKKSSYVNNQENIFEI